MKPFSQDSLMIGRAGKVLRLVRVMRILRVFKVEKWEFGEFYQFYETRNCSQTQIFSWFDILPAFSLSSPPSHRFLLIITS